MSDHTPPWLGPKPNPWPTEAEVKAATRSLDPTPNPTPDPAPSPPDPTQSPTGLSQVKLSNFDADILSIAGTLQEGKCESIVVIGVNKDGQVISLRRPGDVSHPYAVVGALEAMKSFIIANEINQVPVESKRGAK